MQTLLQDLRYGARMLLKKPGFTLIAVITLSLGIGANTAIFSVVNAVLIRSLPYEESERLVFLSERSQQLEGMSISWPNYADWRARNNVFEKIGVYNGFSSYNLTGSGEPERLRAGQVSADLFAALRVNAALGRVFTSEEDKPGAEPVVVLSHALWQRRFGGDPNIINRTIKLSDRGYTVIGVMPPGYRFPSGVEIWVPAGQLSGSASWQSRGNHPGLYGVARLKAGATIEQARAEMENIAVALEKEYPNTNQGNRVTITPLRDAIIGNIGTALWVLLGAVGCVLLIACANVANLLLARASTRQREIAVRVAMGAGRWRIMRQLLTESVLLAVAGGVIGVALSLWGVDLILAISPDSIPRAAEIGLDRGVLAFTAAVSILTGLIFGLAPALQASKVQLHDALKESGRSLVAGRHWSRSVLVVAETALTLALLVGAGLLIRSFYNLYQVNPGFVYDRLLSFSVSLPEQKYATLDQQMNFFHQLMQNLRATPGVESVSVASGLPLGNNGWQTSFTIVGRPRPKPGETLLMEACLVGPDYFRTIGVPLIRGRWFDERDNREHLKTKDLTGYNDDERLVAGVNALIIDEEFARRYWPNNEDPVGKQIIWGDGTDPKSPVMTVVGVVGRVKMDGLNTDSNRVQGYFPFYQAPSSGMTVIVKSALDPNQLIATARRQTLRLDPNQPIYDIRTMEKIRSDSVAPERLNLTLLGMFAALAMILALVGIYGVMSYAVTQRTHEIGVRMALGAQTGDVLKMVVRQGLTLALIGVGAGLTLAYWLTKWMKDLLFEVKPADPATFAVIAAMLILVALVACWIPARRATKVDPMIALRCE
jgi:putative ABC transport system permease protein